MPKPAQYTLIWSAEREAYAACEEKQRNALSLRESDATWFDWLAGRTSFSFQGRYGRLNLLKEMRSRGHEGYWYAYLRQGNHTIKRYAGRTPDLTIARLETLAKTLSTCTSQTPLPHTGAASLQGETTLGPLRSFQLHPPRLLIPLIVREGLLNALDAGLERTLTLLCAPAGFGKTMLLTQWVARQQRQVAWLSLSHEQNDPLCFLSYLLGSLQQVLPGFGSDILSNIRFSLPASASSLTDSLVYLLNELANLPTEMTMILDNYHLIENHMVHNAVKLLLDSLPPHIHLIIASRCEPPWLSARLRVSGDLTELRTDALHLTHEELTELLTHMLHLNPEAEELAALEKRIEGWITGLYLARSALQGQTDWTHFLAACSGTNRHLQTYLLEEVLTALPPDLQTFLLSTASLQCCNSSLCTAVTGREDSMQLLEELSRVNLFFCPMIEREGWYRYHPLFASALSAYLARTQLELATTLHQRASRWFEAHDSPIEAIEHALAAQDYSHAATLIEGVAPTLISEGKITLLRNWLDTLPDELVRSSPRLCISRVWQEFITSQPHTFILWVEVAEQALHRLGEALPLATIATLQSEISALRSLYTISFEDFSSAIASCQQALQHLPTDSHYLRGLNLLLLGLAYTRSTDVGAAARALSEANSNMQAAGHVLLVPYVMMAQAELYAAQGYPFQATKLYRHVLALESGQGVSSLFVTGLAHAGLSCLLWEWNNLTECRDHSLQAWTMGKHTQNCSLLFQSVWLLTQVAQVQGENDAAQWWLHQLESLSQYLSYAELTEVVVPIRACFALMENRLEEALFWMREQSQHDAVSNHRHSELIDLAQARVLIAAGQAGVEPDGGARALERLDYWYVTADQAGRVRVLIEVLILRALALQLQNDRVGALHALERAVTLAEPGRYIRLFVAEGDSLARLLRLLLEQQRAQKANGQGTHIAYLCTLLKAFAQPDTFFLPTPRAESQPIFDPLSLREREVLRLIADGRKNREIADELVVVIGTVKAHINMIYQKLGVTNRVQAVTRARSLGLLEG